jgi:alkylation response protein AidB-like acyl-CoA dehydrogenase
MRPADDARAVEAGDALKVSGTWRGVPGAGLAPWFVLRLAADRAVAVSALNLAVTLNDHQAGLRGAGIGEVVASSVSVPRAQVLSLTEPMQRLHALAPLGVVIGGAEGGYRDYVTSTRKRAASVGGAAVARFIQVQTRLGEAEADLNAARMTAEGCVSSLLTAPRAVLDRDAAYAARLALRAVTLLVQQMGAVGIHETNVVQRHARDLRASTADRRLAWDAAMAARGRAELGIADADRAVETVAV